LARGNDCSNEWVVDRLVDRNGPPVERIVEIGSPAGPERPGAGRLTASCPDRGLMPGVVGEHDAFLGDVHGDLVWGVARRVQQVEVVIADPEGEVAGEDHGAFVGVAVVLVAVGEERGAVGSSTGIASAA